VTTVLLAVAALLLLAACLTLVRLLRGPTLYDRLVALDLLVVVVLGGILVASLWRGEGPDVVLLVVVALVGFLSTVSVLRFDVEEPR
jgi:multicomponent Na+:H+ antiporter subunit F